MSSGLSKSKAFALYHGDLPPREEALESRASHGGWHTFYFRPRHGQESNGLESHVLWQGADPPREKGVLFFAQRLPQLAGPWPVLAKEGFHFLIPTAQQAPRMADTEKQLECSKA